MKFIAIRKEPSGLLYIDQNFFERFTDNDLATYGYTKVEVPDDFGFSDFDDLMFSYDKYNQRKAREKQLRYENAVVQKIRYKYTLDQEIALLRQRDSKYAEFVEYNEYVEKCKAEAKTEVGYGI